MMRAGAVAAALLIGWAAPVAPTLAQEPAPTLVVESELVAFRLVVSTPEKAEPRLLELGIDAAMTRLEQSLAFAIERRGFDSRPDWRPSALEIASRVSFEGERLLSVVRRIYVNDAGAHPNLELASLLWDRRRGETLALADLFVAGLPPESLRAAWRAELVRMKDERFGEAKGEANGEAMLEEYLGDREIRLEDTPFALTPSTVPGKAAGILFLHAPYEVGAYSEGSYEVLAPLGSFREALRPQFRDSFVSAPAVKPPSDD